MLKAIFFSADDVRHAIYWGCREGKKKDKWQEKKILNFSRINACILGHFKTKYLIVETLLQKSTRRA